MNGPLEPLLRRRIAEQGGVSVADYMGLCLGHPQWGYYATRDPLGKAGDFTTAPEISQMFGELIGLWATVVWQSMGAPERLVLAELGPGRGTLMVDFLRAATLTPGFRKSLEICLVETSPALRRCQKTALADVRAGWFDRVDDLPDGPLLLVANEFFDALPIDQYVRRADGWRQRRVVLEGEGLAFADGPPAGITAPPAANGAIFEINQAARDIAAWLGRRLADQGGAALVIDYGHPQSSPGDTLQAVRRHQPVPVFDHPGDADLTAHVDFQALGEAARPAVVTPMVTQGSFLRSMGIEIRADRLIRSSPDRADVIADACRRLIEPSGMGNLFKVMGIAHPGLPLPPGFPT